MKVLVTGGTGFIGSKLVPYLVKEGHSVTVVDTCWFNKEVTDKVKLIKADIRSKLVLDHLKGYESIIHLAGISNDPAAETYLKSNYDLNTSATMMLAHAAKQQGVPHFIFASSCSVYGFTSTGISREIDEPKPQYPYGLSKVMAERGLLALMSTDFTVSILRKGTVGGWSYRPRFDLVVNTMTMKGITEGIVTVKNSSLWRPLVDIRDVVIAYSTLLKKKYPGIFNLVQANYTIQEIGEAVVASLNKLGKKVKLESYDRYDPRNYKASGDKALELLDLSPKYTIRDTVEDLIENITSSGIDPRSSEWQNIEVLKGVKGLK